MNEQHTRDRADALCAALVDGDIERATQDFSDELRRNLGEVIALLPLPASEASIESFEGTGGAPSATVVLRLVGETEEVLIMTRWKDRDGKPTVIEASHLSRTERVALGVEEEVPADAEAESEPEA